MTFIFNSVGDVDIKSRWLVSGEFVHTDEWMNSFTLIRAELHCHFSDVQMYHLDIDGMIIR